jgi:2-polyprenyl-6-hydroxyphenyl methylase/3-demethylubiquinone-9 3-methyltransferase
MASASHFARDRRTPRDKSFGRYNLPMVATTADSEIAAGERFAFGANWREFLKLVDDARVAAAEESLSDKLGDVSGARFVDVGCGSGLFSLAARNLGAEVTSFDFDRDAVECAAELRRRFRSGDQDWRIEQGSALDRDYLASLGQFDIVYSWGVLHHTGDLWTALGNAEALVAPTGRLFISIYNDQGRRSRVWRRVKRRYNRSGPLGRWFIYRSVDLYFAAGRTANRALGEAYRRYAHLPRPSHGERRPRGMDRKHDMLDWVGGWPFEVARPEQVFRFFRDRGYVLRDMTTCGGGLGCNQFVLQRNG